MKRAEAVLVHIDRLYERYLMSPQHYASDPMAFEQILILLEDIREFILDKGGREDQPARSGYALFLQEQGYGALTFTARRAEEQRAGRSDDLQLFREMSMFWRQFLRSPLRCTS